MIAHLPDWAETQIQDRCDRLGILRQKPTQDRTGWDYILELPATKVPGMPADKQPIELSAKLQVKSKRTGKPGVSINLLNARRFARDSLPCFIVQFVATKGGEPVSVYVREFGNDLIEATMRRIREADHQRRTDLHKITMVISFSEADDHTSDFMEWIEERVRSGGPNYGERKHSFSEEIGYENGGIVGRAIFPRAEISKLQDHALGLGGSLNVEHIEVFDQRFGINSAEPIFAGKPHSFKIEASSKPACAKLTNELGNSISIDGEFRVAPSFGAQEANFKARFTSDAIELILGPSGSAKFSSNLQFNDVRKLSSLQRSIDVLISVEMGEVEGVLDIDGSPLEFLMDAKIGRRDPWKENVATVLGTLRRVAGFSRKSEPQISIDQMNAAWDALDLFNAFANGPTAKADVTLADSIAVASEVSFLLGFATVDVAEWSFAAVVERRVVEVLGGDRQFTYLFGAPRILEGAISKDGGRVANVRIRDAYKRRLSKKRGGVLQVGNGDFMNTSNDTRNIRYIGPDAAICR